jgi:hypothetical protein
VAACTSVPASQDGVTYHCVETSRPVPPPNTFATPWPLVELEYGEYRISNRPTIGHNGYCANLLVPKNAHLSYKVGDQLISKDFDLSALSPGRVYRKNVVFFVDGETVEVRLESPRQGALPSVVLITRQ